MKQLFFCAWLLPLMASAAGNEAVLYDGYGSVDRFTLEGRVIEAERRAQPDGGDSWWKNLWRNVRLMKNSERGDIALTIMASGIDLRVTTNEEGYFRASATPAPAMRPGWHAISAQGKQTQGQGRLLIVPAHNTLGVISDIDDTVMISAVPDKTKLLNNTFLKNPQQRQAFPGTADFYRRLLAQNPEPAAAPMFYLSASPRQLAGNIAAFLNQNQFPPGVLLTKQINGEERDPLRDQKQYKLAKIEALLAALPWVNFVLVGDDGELDPEIYRAIQEKYPQRVKATYIRRVSPDPKRARYPDQRDLAAASVSSTPIKYH